MRQGLVEIVRGLPSIRIRMVTMYYVVQTLLDRGSVQLKFVGLTF